LARQRESLTKDLCKEVKAAPRPVVGAQKVVQSQKLVTGNLEGKELQLFLIYCVKVNEASGDELPGFG
jgi:hypothetical protein